MPRITPQQYRLATYVALGALSVIVLTGAAVRLTDSGLGCPDWPRCYGKALPPLSSHAVIEYSNRAVSGLVGVITIVVFALAFLRTPRRRDLIWLSASLPLGVLAQAVLGGFTVREHLAPGFVMAHFGLSMIVLIGAVALAWRASHEPDPLPASAPASDRIAVWSARALLPLGALAIFVGTGATAAGPHSGGAVGDNVHRLRFKGNDTLVWIVHRHATIAAIFGVAVIGVWLLHRRRAIASTLEPLTALGVLLAAQGLVGAIQYELHLPSDIVWVHVGLATFSWLAILWVVAAAGRLAPRTATAEVGARGAIAAEQVRQLEGAAVR